MAKGSKAKELVAEKIVETFGDAVVGIVDKKIYIESEEDGNKIQVCITMTIPKTQVERESAAPIGEAGSPQISTSANQVTLSPADAAKVQELMEKLGVKK